MRFQGVWRLKGWHTFALVKAGLVGCQAATPYYESEASWRAQEICRIPSDRVGMRERLPARLEDTKETPNGDFGRFLVRSGRHATP